MSLRVFLTGASGLLGGELTARLIAREHGVTALVHNSRTIRGNDGAAIASVPWAGRAPDPGTLLTIEGDVARPGLGLAEAARVAAAHDLIVHCAAATGFGLDPATYEAVNVEGTREAALLAAGAGIPLLHVSTAYVCGDQDGRVDEGALGGPGSFANLYEESKAAGERIVRASGAAAAIARPSIVLGEHESGAIRSFDATYAAFKLMATGRVSAFPAASGATLDFVPIDHVAAGLADIAERMSEAAGRTFHLGSASPIPVEDFASAIAAFPQLRAPRVIAAEHFDPADLPPAERRIHARITGFYDAYFQRAPIFDDANLRALTGRICPPTGRDYVVRLIRYCVEAGFLPREAEAVSPAPALP